MSTKQRKTIGAASLGLMLMAWTGTGMAEGGFFSKLYDKTTFNGALRADLTWRTTSEQNQYNQNNVPYQDVEVTRQAYVPPALSTGLPANVINSIIPGAIPGTALDWNTPFPNIAPYTDTIRRNDRVNSDDLETSYTVLRFTGEMDMKFTKELRINARLRALYDPTIYDEFDARDLANDQGGITGGGGDRYADTGKPNYYEALGRNGRQINPLELAGRDYFVDFGTLIINYKKSNYDIRIGSQQIAWGQAIFFRTFDVANGLDLRRHLVLNRGIEEFEDVRVPKLAVRATVQASDTMLIDSYVGKFQPDILPNPNTPYNVIPSQFYRPLDNYYSGGYDNKLDYGVRIKADFGNWGYQAMAVSRYNPLGVFSWAVSGINNGLYGSGGGASGPLDLSTQVEAAYIARPPCTGLPTDSPSTCRLYGSIGESLSHGPLTIAPGGVYSDLEWFSTAASVRLDGLAALNKAIEDFPALRDSFASEVADITQARHLLNTFFIGSGGSIRGTVERDYYREEVYGLGGLYILSATPGTFWDQFIINLEVQYSPNRRFTGPDLGAGDEKDETIITLVGEKWYRWSDTFPAAYLVFQGMHRSASDLVGLSLDGYGGNLGNTEPKLPDGLGSANYLVFAGFQPWPNRKFIAEWAMLLDVEGGLLAQPLIKWNPGYGVSFDFFYNYTDGKLYGDGESTLTRAIEADDELAMRVTYQF